MGAYSALRPVCLASAAETDSLNVHFVTDEPDAVLQILDDLSAGHVPDGDWARLFSSEGYRRLAVREAAIKEPLDEATFRQFVLSDTLRAQRAYLRSTLQSWSHIDVHQCARRALAYLPDGSRMRAAVYPEIKPRKNSFVFDLERDPGIFLYLDPAISPTELTYTVSHELHHVGFAQNCPTPETKHEVDSLSPRLKLFVEWLGAFGEGFAVLAGAGGADVDPGTVVGPSAAPEWATERETFAPRLNEIIAFFRSIISGQRTGDAATTQGMTFFGNQGPWYTVGWRMATTIERKLGRAQLVACIVDNRRFIVTYNTAAQGTGLPLWPSDLSSLFGSGA